MEFDNQVAVVTGAGQGIGHEIALALARNGANLVLLGRRIDILQSAAREVEAIGCQALAVKCDITKKKEVEEAAKTTFDRFHSIDILVNNAGTGAVAATEEMSEEEWDRVIDTDLKGTFLCSQAFGKYMIKRGKGKIVNIASICGHVAVPGRASYCSAKAGAVMLTKVLAVEWAKFGITVNSISPGVVETPLIARLRAEAGADVSGVSEAASKIPLGRIAKPEDIANVVVFLASSKADYITGQDIGVEGGVLAIHPRYA